MSEHTAENDAPTPEDVCAERHGETHPYPCAECRSIADRDVPDVVGLLDGYRPRKPLPLPDYDEYADRGDPR